MKTPVRIAILASGHYLTAIGLKTLLTEIGGSIEILLINSITDLNNVQDIRCIISFRPIPGLITTIIEDNADDVTIKNQINKILAETGSSVNNPDEDLQPKESPLSQRELDVLRLVATGLINKEIAERLNISLQTVLTHRKNISRKLGIRTSSGFTAYALINRLI